MILARLMRLVLAHEDSAGKPPSEIVLCPEWHREFFDAMLTKPGEAQVVEFQRIPVRQANPDEVEVYTGRMKAITKR